MQETNILVLGGSGAGKTHYAGQLLGRMRHDRLGKLRLLPGGIENLNKLEEVLKCLEEGRAAGHTPAETWMGIQCQLETQNGDKVLLEWPEYAGERLFAIIEQRLLADEWRQSIVRSSAWILFIRPSTLQIYEDILVRPTGVAPQSLLTSEIVVHGKGWDHRAQYVELLQMLLFATGCSTFHKISKPRLTVILSCWDELEQPKSPEDMLAARLPLLVVHA